jgi:hypothetical protein
MKSQCILVADSDQIQSSQGFADFIPRMLTDTDTFFNGQTVSGEGSILPYVEFRRS